uniref:Nuclear pore complex protein Nup160-like n=1 Tax=Phallusia mammillata TaxID=59560 RepID=A0A6F9DNF1_9ASCI|nr:nuclear pore complex protein Nup160-like [Phallusia mammillata]
MAYMDTKKTSNLLFLEVSAHFSNAVGKKTHEIYVNEGDPDDTKLSECSTYPDCGGGQDIPVLNTNIKRTLYWRTHSNVLELFEYSFNSNLQHNHYEVLFQNSKILPGLQIFCTGGQVVVLFSTIHATHRVVFNAPHIRNKDRSILHGLSATNFTDENNVFYFTQPEQFSHMTSGVTGSPTARQQLGAIFTLVGANGNLSIVKMPHKGQATMLQMNRASRMSRIWSGINPWAGSGSGETPCGLKLVCLDSGNPKVVGICRDHKIRVWSCKSLDCVAQFDMKPHLQDDTPGLDGNSSHKISITYNDVDDVWILSVCIASEHGPKFFIFEAAQDISAIEHISTIDFVPDGTVLQPQLVDFMVSSNSHLWALLLDSEDQISLAVCEMETAIWHEVALSTPPLSEVIVCCFYFFCCNM